MRGAAADGTSPAHMSKRGFSLAAVQDAKKLLLNLRRSLSSNSGDQSDKIVLQTQEAFDKLWKSVIPLEEEPSHEHSFAVSKLEGSTDIVVEIKGPKVVGTINLSDQLLLDLSDIFSVDKDTDAIESEEVNLIISNIV